MFIIVTLRAQDDGEKTDTDRKDADENGGGKSGSDGKDVPDEKRPTEQTRGSRMHAHKVCVAVL